ncbi:MAG: XRE family transcriptional regulator [Bacillota bacterium]|nr:MAG: XRE family transcriptional regulator [Bacillota bacterium]
MVPGQRIRLVREQHQLTLAQLAGRLGRTKQWLSDLERGKIKLTYETAVAIAHEFGTTPDAILLPEAKTAQEASAS